VIIKTLREVVEPLSSRVTETLMDLQEARRPRATPLPNISFSLKAVYCTVFWDMRDREWSSVRRKGQHEIRRTNLNVGGVILAALPMKCTVLYDKRPWSLVKIYWRIGRNRCIHIQGMKMPSMHLHHEDRINKLLRNTDKFLSEYTASHIASQKTHNAH
jgi:hypothetical protein